MRTIFIRPVNYQHFTINMSSAPSQPPSPPATGSSAPHAGCSRIPGSAALTGSGAPIRSYLLLCNIGKKQNFGQLVRSAVAFGVAEIGVVGCKKIRDLQLFGDQGTSAHAKFRFFDTIASAKAWYVEHGVDVCGIEISNDSRVLARVEPIYSGENLGREDEDASSTNIPPTFRLHQPFRRSTAFLLGNEGTGMSEKQLEICDLLTYIPQHSAGTASLNVLVAGSIVLAQFALVANFSESHREGGKFLVAQPRKGLAAFENPTEEEADEVERKREERRLKRQKLMDEGAVGGGAREGAVDHVVRTAEQGGPVEGS